MVNRLVRDHAGTGGKSEACRAYRSFTDGNNGQRATVRVNAISRAGLMKLAANIPDA